jgi:hypothetical protein
VVVIDAEKTAKGSQSAGEDKSGTPTAYGCEEHIFESGAFREDGFSRSDIRLVWENGYVVAPEYDGERP